MDENNKSGKNFLFDPAVSCIDRSAVSSWCLPVIRIEDRESEKEDLKTRIARIEMDAYQKGFEQGRKDGLELEEKKIEEMSRELELLLGGISDLKEKIFIESEGELLKLSVLIAKKIIGEEITINKNVIENTIRSALKLLTDKRKLKIIINPHDMENVRRLLPDLSRLSNIGRISLSEDPSLINGGCILETGFGRINAGIEDQIAMLEEEIERQYQHYVDESNGPFT
ncbi:MAG: hypothetical protein JW882_03415 [Deltaproteobacteria bacterium]|nr:hypothetical protein [Deltaproteobacteria bacterium]